MHPDIFFTIDKNTGSNYSVSAKQCVPVFATTKILLKYMIVWFMMKGTSSL